jgi:hypothetical protein
MHWENASLAHLVVYVITPLRIKSKLNALIRSALAARFQTTMRARSAL